MHGLQPIDARQGAPLLAPRSPRTRILAGWLIALLAVAGLWLAYKSKSNLELEVYIKGALRMQRGEAVHVVEDHSFAYPAAFALPFVPLSRLPTQTQQALWALINSIVTVLILWRIWARLQGIISAPAAIRVPAWFFCAVVLVLAGRHLVAPLENQSHDLLVLLCVVLLIDASCAFQENAAGALGGLASAFKLTPLLFAPVFLWQRRWGAAVSLVAAVLVFTFLPDLLYPANDHAPWIVTYYRNFLSQVQLGSSADADGVWCPVNIGNQSLAGTLRRLWDHTRGTHFELSEAGRKALILGTQLAVVGWLGWITRNAVTYGLPRAELAVQRFGQGGAVLIGMMLLSPTSVKTNLCGMVVPIAFCVADFLYRRRSWLVGALLSVNFFLGTLTVRGADRALLDDRGAWLAQEYGVLTCCMLATLLATGVVLLQRSAQYRQTTSALPPTLGLRMSA